MNDAATAARYAVLRPTCGVRSLAETVAAIGDNIITLTLYSTKVVSATANHMNTLAVEARPDSSWLFQMYITACYIHLEQPGGVTANQSTASVPITVMLYNGPLLCDFNGLNSMS